MSDETVCIPNIGPQQRRRRVIGGVIGLGLGAVLSAWFLASGMPRPWRALVFLPFFMGTTGLFQARAKTCVALVARNERNLDAGPEPVNSESEQRQLRAQASKVYAQSLFSAFALCAAVLAIP